MAKRFEIQHYKDGKVVQLSSAFTKRRVMFYILSLQFLAGAACFTSVLFNLSNPGYGPVFILLITITVFLMAFYKLISKATVTERLYFNHQQMVIVVSSIFKTKRRSFLLKHISDFKFVGSQNVVTETTKLHTYDAAGLITDDKIVQHVNDTEGRVSFSYLNQEVRFGNELTSWECEELEKLLQMEKNKIQAT